jgi:hypothetical protein
MQNGAYSNFHLISCRLYGPSGDAATLMGAVSKGLNDWRSEKGEQISQYFR